MSWYHVAEGRQSGPITEEQFKALVASGTIRPETLVWREGMAAWSPYGTVAGAASGAIAMQAIKEGVPLPGGFAFGGFWIRFLARFVDWLILVVVNVAVSIPFSLGLSPDTGATGAFAMQGVIFLINFAIGVAYETFFVGRFGGTPGKMVCKLRIVRPDGSPISYARACGRYFAGILSSLTLLIGYIMAGFDAQKRALHDLICDTRVVKE